MLTFQNKRHFRLLLNYENDLFVCAAQSHMPNKSVIIDQWFRTLTLIQTLKKINDSSEILTIGESFNAALL